ncbi:uncharacterized protein TRAVEDRAFT_71842 [Trametes versicolor FP-101664 SS1]|uniref:uncharacterized protein n=1 Tax=Trametes versicolor (strain FP-101664) TaxID=717944 RepID=UPI0004623F8F|nr:uncharacterized protein TRAVEDRAFT_71842 [Trametes versicolor FP-101664 SS1]EIW58128.1 hypothetical protein TRAVEDRAFT_71842 [Trametes versicolor FP-101664 SS1]
MSTRKNSKQTPATKQAKLSFASKRNSSTASAAAGKQQKADTVRKPSLARAAGSRSVSTTIPTEPISISISDSDSDVSFNDDYVVPETKKRRVNPPRGPAAKKARKAQEEDVVEEAEPEKAKTKLDLEDKRWRKQYGVVREKMGHLEPVHAQGQTMVHHILRVFDLSYEYGPCIGVSRLDRWERAHALGLNPPSEVKDILLTKEGSTDEQFTQSVFHNQV